jgi:hypothetical protein
MGAQSSTTVAVAESKSPLIVAFEPATFDACYPLHSQHQRYVNEVRRILIEYYHLPIADLIPIISMYLVAIPKLVLLRGDYVMLQPSKRREHEANINRMKTRAPTTSLSVQEFISKHFYQLPAYQRQLIWTIDMTRRMALPHWCNEKDDIKRQPHQRRLSSWRHDQAQQVYERWTMLPTNWSWAGDSLANTRPTTPSWYNSIDRPTHVTPHRARDIPSLEFIHPFISRLDHEHIVMFDRYQPHGAHGELARNGDPPPPVVAPLHQPLHIYSSLTHKWNYNVTQVPLNYTHVAVTHGEIHFLGCDPLPTTQPINVVTKAMSLVWSSSSSLPKVMMTYYMSSNTWERNNPQPQYDLNDALIIASWCNRIYVWFSVRVKRSRSLWGSRPYSLPTCFGQMYDPITKLWSSHVCRLHDYRFDTLTVSLVTTYLAPFSISSFPHCCGCCVALICPLVLQLR